MKKEEKMKKALAVGPCRADRRCPQSQQDHKKARGRRSLNSQKHPKRSYASSCRELWKRKSRPKLCSPRGQTFTKAGGKQGFSSRLSAAHTLNSSKLLTKIHTALHPLAPLQLIVLQHSAKNVFRTFRVNSSVVQEKEHPGSESHVHDSKIFHLPPPKFSQL